MRKNPYNKGLKDQLPLLMSGPSTITALTKNEEQKVVLEKSMMSPLHKYEVKGVTFTMVQPPFINQNGTYNPQEIADIEMGWTEVTQDLFEVVMGWNDSFSRDPKNPVEMVTWFDCITFCNALSNRLGFRPCYKVLDVEEDDWDENHIDEAKPQVTWDETAKGFRLLTEYEWESFAKAGTQNAWSGTNLKSELGKYAWYRDNSGDETHPVGGKLPNEWGLYDMSGNVYEWCWDKYKPDDDRRRVLRGGSFWNYEDSCRVAYRSGDYADERYDTLGFRICRTIK